MSNKQESFYNDVYVELGKKDLFKTVLTSKKLNLLDVSIGDSVTTMLYV